MTLSDSRPGPPPHATLKTLPPPGRVSPDYPRHPSDVPCPLPRWTRMGARIGCFPIPRGLPRNSGGSAPTTSLSRPAQASHTLRPARSLDRPRRPSSRGFGQVGRPTKPLVSYRSLPTTLRVVPSSTGVPRLRAHVESRKGAVSASISSRRPVSPPRSSNRTCGFPASGFPTGFIARHTAAGQYGHAGDATPPACRRPLRY